MNDTPNQVDCLFLAEWCCWSIVALTPVLNWINGEVVSRDQLVVRTTVPCAALITAIALRMGKAVRSKRVRPKGDVSGYLLRGQMPAGAARVRAAFGTRARTGESDSVPVATSESVTRGCAERHTSARGPTVVPTMILGLHALLLTWGASRHSPTIDEVPYLTAGISHWSMGAFDLCRVNPPLVRLVAALPVIACGPRTDWTVYSTQEPSPTYRADFPAGGRFIQANAGCVFRYFNLARYACIPFSLLGAWLCFRWGNELFGHPAGTLALLLWCFSPNMIGHGQLITPDVGGAAMGLAAAYCFWHWLRDPSWGRAGMAGVTLGLAQLARSTWIVLFGLWPAMWLLWTGPFLRRGAWRISFRRVTSLAFVLVLALYVLNIGYGFDGTFRPLGEYNFVSRALAGFDTLGGRVYGNRFRGGAFAKLPVPLPQDYVQGMDIQRGDFEAGAWSYLRGQWRNGGWAYYYAYAVLIKVPLGTWLLILLSSLCALLCREYRATWRSELLLLLPGVAVFLLASSQTGLSHHMRYVLGAFPFAFIWTSRVARSTVLGQRGVAVVGATALGWTVSSSLGIYPHSMSYFNELVGGPTRGQLHLIDSNIDWGQDLLYFTRWLENHPEACPLQMAYFPSIIDPALAGISYRWPPMDARSPRVAGCGADDVGPQPGWHAVSVNELHAQQGQYAYFLEFEPVARAGYSIHIYRITVDEANRVRKKIGLPRLPANWRPGRETDDRQPRASGSAHVVGK